MSLVWKLGIASGVLGALLTFAWSQQRILIYVPDRTRADPVQSGLPKGTEIRLRTPDGVELIAWHQPAMPNQPTLLYFHGNGGNLLDRAGRMAEYLKQGRGFLMLSYRGYGGSGGKPSEKANVADATLAYEFLLEKGVPAADIILYGESLGSGVAVQLAAARPVGGVILDAPYTSIADVGARVYPLLPVHALLLDRYDTLARIDRINAPLLIVHGEEDNLIPVTMGETVFEKAKEPKTMRPVAGAGHSDHHLFGSYDLIKDWIDNVWKPIRGRRP